MKRLRDHLSDDPAPLRWLMGMMVLLLCLGGALRFWNLPHPPAGPYYDEAANGILAASIANKGYRPIFITSYTGKEVLFFYLAALVMKITSPDLLALRITSALLGTGTIAATLWCVYELYASSSESSRMAKTHDTNQTNGRFASIIQRIGSRPPSAIILAVLTASLLASSFWHLTLSRVGLRAVAQPLLQSLALAALWRGLRTNDRRFLVMGGFFCGLTGYTYLAARLYPVPIALALLALLGVDRQQFKLRLTQIGLYIGSAIITFAPLGWYFIQNPDRFAIRIEQVAAEGTRLTYAQAFSRAFGIFFVRGDPLARLNIPGKPIFGPVMAILFVLGLLIVALYALRSREPLIKARSVLLLSWIPIMILPTALTVTDIIPHYLRAAGLLPLVYLFPALALTTLLEIIPRKSVRHARILFALIVVLVLAPTTHGTIRDYFVNLANRSDHYEISDGDLADMAQWLDKNDHSESDIYIASIHYRHPTLAFMAQDYASFKWLTGGRTLVIPSDRSGLLLVPRSIDFSWAEPYLYPITALATPLAPDGKSAFQAWQIEPPVQLSPNYVVKADFAHVIQLEGYDLLGIQGKNAQVVLYWRAMNPPPGDDYQAFIHLKDEWDLTWTERLPFQYPSSQWSPGEQILDRMRVPLVPGIPPGDYVLQVGLYSAAQDNNLTIVKADGSFGGLIKEIPMSLTQDDLTNTGPLNGYRDEINVEITPHLWLLGYNLDTPYVRTGEILYLSLFWQATAAPGDISVRISLGETQIYQNLPVHGSYPSSTWRPGEGVLDRYAIRVPLDTPPGSLPLSLEVISGNGKNPGIDLGMVQVESPPRSFEVPVMEYRTRLQLDETVELLGYDLGESEGDSVALTLYWRTLKTMDADYTVFVHARGKNDALVGQVDSQPQAGQYPTSLWAEGEVVSDAYTLSIPADAVRPLSLQVGMYLPLTGEQLGTVELP